MFRRLTALVCVAVFICGGCTRNQGGAASPAPPTGPSSSDAGALPTTAMADPMADSSLSIKRGVITASVDHLVFRACNDRTDLWLIDESEAALNEMLAAGTASYVEVYGERAPVPEEVPAARGAAGVFILEQLLYATAAGEGAGCEKPASTFTVAARGNEPFWSVQVTATQMIWRQPEAPGEITLNALQVQEAEGTVSYRANAAGHELELRIDAQACRDSMSGEFFAFAARAVLDGKEFTGCARVGK